LVWTNLGAAREEVVAAFSSALRHDINITVGERQRPYIV